MSSQHTRLNLSAGTASVTMALCLVVIKLWAVVQTQSLSVAASTADSALDLLVSALGLAGIVYASRPPDDDHAFGHSSAEDLTALAQALFLLVTAVALAGVSLQRLLSPAPAPLASEGTGITVMVISIVLTGALVLWQRRVARLTGNRVVAADSLHYLSDLLPSLGAILALWLSARYGITDVDTIVGLIASVVLFAGAVKIGTGAWNALMDRRVDPALIAEVETIIRDYPGIMGFHDLRSRTAGSQIFFDFHIELDGTLTLNEAHAIGAGLRRRIMETYPQMDILIHKDPCDADR
ncbi:cation diffusion facilitator family transporter [Sedimentitalea todarodis]|uniref:Cation diffusion facilitator family transporter n=1 Tax=Sedimentitalea todarodis TaxID=1631240 RepID=A0ABU3V960_9RHOB|nr:cation diffusion facilitator family transporter [Sedimentitalea todarodis]MDU9002707.1 cation diffusion facilitator family transporter [Sedimentitalea todarodis]